MGKSAISEWMPFYGDRFLKDFAVVGMSDTARLLYIVLLWRQWESGGLPQESEVVARISTLGVKSFNRSWREVEPMFPVDSDGLRRNQTLAGHRDAALGKIEGYRDNAARMNAVKQRAPTRAPTRAPSRDSSRSPSLDGDGDGDIAPPPPRLLMALDCWDATRPPNIAHAPKPSPSLAGLFLAVDAPHLDWHEIIAWVFANPFTNGLGKPSKGNTAGYRADFTWMLKPKNLVTATTRVVDPESMTASPQRDRDAAIIAESIRITERTANRKAIQ